MNTLDKLLKVTKRFYDRGEAATDDVCETTVYCLQMLRDRAQSRHLAICDGKSYSVYCADGALSRPYLADLLVPEAEDFEHRWNELVQSADVEDRRFRLMAAEMDVTIYTVVASFALCYDLWKTKSRKTPGTFFEIVLGSLLQLILPNHVRARHVILPNQIENVSTDIVFSRPNEHGGLVIPVKITTRERVVQPYAHQRILDSVFGEGQFRSALVCMSEMQRSGTDNCNAICVPGTIRLYQSHLAKLSGIYYLDPPSRYLAADVSQVVSVQTVGQLLARDVARLTE